MVIFFFFFSTVIKKVAVSSIPTPGHFWAYRMFKDNAFVPFDPGAWKEKDRHKLYQGTVPVDHDTQLYISIFYDGFTSSPTRYKSVGGLYMTVLNMKLKVSFPPSPAFSS